MWIEILGYLASALIAVSMIMVSVVRLRIINLLGSTLFIVYALLLPSVPVLIANLFIVAVNIWHLNKSFRNGRAYCDYIAVGSERHDQIMEYYDVHAARIASFYPHFEKRFIDLAWQFGGQVFIAFHQSKIRGFAVYIPLSQLKNIDLGNYAGLKKCVESAEEISKIGDAVFLLLDYIDSKYRDLGLYTKLYKQLNYLGSREFESIFTVCNHEIGRSRAYFKTRGFKLKASSSGLELYQLEFPFF